MVVSRLSGGSYEKSNSNFSSLNIFSLMVGCNPNLNSKTPGDQLAAQNQNIDELPTVFENPDIDIESVTQAEPTVTAPNPQHLQHLLHSLRR